MPGVRLIGCVYTFDTLYYQFASPPHPTPPHLQAQALFAAPRVVVSHQTQSDPVLCYGNRMALALWEMDLQTLTATPSRLTAEPMERAERQRLLDAGEHAGWRIHRVCGGFD